QLYGQRVDIEARAAAGLANHAHIGQERHRDLLHALAFAFLAAAAARIEREAARGPAAHARFRGIREEAPDLVPEADVGGGAGARRLADRRLVDLQHALDVLLAAYRFAADGRLFHHRLVEHIARERRFARAGDAGDGDQSAERQADVDVFQVVQFRLMDL